MVRIVSATCVAAVAVAATLILASPAPVRAQAALTPHQQLAREIYEQLIEINTTDSQGNTTEAAEAMAARLIDAGFAKEDVQVLGPSETDRKGNLVARLHGSGSGGGPLLLLAHLDVVEARREDWSMDPFTFIEKDGFFYGRGTSDDKAMAAIFTANLIRMKQQGIVPDRDIILALTADEEGGDYNGVSWLIANHPDIVKADYALNEGGGGQLEDGKRLLNAVQASEKVYLSFRLESKNPGGHSSRPTKDNAIYHLANALVHVSQYDFPVKLNEVTRTYFQRMAAIETGETAAAMKAVSDGPTPDAAAVATLSMQPYYNALMRTTCVATMLDGGHAENALPQTAGAIVNCRILPGEPPDEVERTLNRIVGDPKVTITPVAEPKPSPPSPLTPEIMQPIERITEEMWPGVPVVPIMSTGATDGLYFRQIGTPVYGVSGLFGDVNDSRAHGKDERMAVQSFFEGLEFLDRLVRALAVPKT